MRPRCEAVPIPRHNMINGGNRTPGGLAGPSPGRKRGLLCGRAEPAPPGGRPSELGRPSGERSEMTPRKSSRRGAVSAPALQGRTQAEA